MNDLQLSSYFPDGTLCHTEGSTKFYCQRNMCVEEGHRYVTTVDITRVRLD